MESAPVLKPYRGFTLIEMIVVLGIILLLTTIMVVSQSDFNRSILLTDTAYKVALSARQAQTFGLSSRRFGVIQNAGYGIHFDGASPRSYLVFADTTRRSSGTIASTCILGTPGRPDEKPGDCYYAAGQDGIQSTFGFTRDFSIQNICLTYAWGTFCTRDSPTYPPLQSADIVFMRPNTSTVITGTFQGLGYVSSPASCAEIMLADVTEEATKSVRITQLGEVSVGKSCI